MRSFHAAVAALLGAVPVPAAADTVRENITFFNEDGTTYVEYSTLRSNYSSYNFHRSGGSDATLDEYYYIYPNDYDWRTSDDEPNVLHFPQGDYALLSGGDFGDQVEVGTDGVYTYSSWDGEKRPNGHFGVWNAGGPFDQLVMAWVFPRGLEIVSYESNRDGDWVIRQNTLSYFGSDVNDVTFTLRYRRREQQIYEALKADLIGQDQVEIVQGAEGIRVALDEAVLFPSGSAELTGDGEALLAELTETLTQNEAISIIVEGHTDNVPIEGNLAEAFPTNWELSAARALAVVHRLAETGLPERAIEARAFGPHRPRASNDTPESRARNRRVELVIDRSD